MGQAEFAGRDLPREEGQELPWPTTPEALAGLEEVDRQALLSHYFLGLSTLNLAAVATGDDFYNNTFLPLVFVHLGDRKLGLGEA